MATIDIAAVRRRLESERDRVLEERRHLLEDTSRSLEEAVDEDGNDSHLADSATETVDREIELSLEDNADRQLQEIDAALGRLDAGSYGRCERCGAEIDAERLDALPWAAKCIDCKRLEERG
jgi:DnaK suppressor protein